MQESFNNIARHARAHVICISLTHANGRINLAVTDHGVGFDPSAGYPGHMGLSSMQERAAAIGARLSIDSAPGKGTRVNVELPA